MDIDRRDRQLFQYKNATRFNRMLDELWEVVNDISMGDLYRFLDVDQAEGEWLTQLARIFNEARYYAGLGDPFRLDSSLLDSTDVLDGYYMPLSDEILRLFIKSRIVRNTAEVKSIEYIYTVILGIFEPDVCKVEESSVKNLTITMEFPDESGLNLLNALNAIDDKWFGCPAGVSVTWNIS